MLRQSTDSSYAFYFTKAIIARRFFVIHNLNPVQVFSCLLGRQVLM